jgi:hypothetical protein
MVAKSLQIRISASIPQHYRLRSIFSNMRAFSAFDIIYLHLLSIREGQNGTTNCHQDCHQRWAQQCQKSLANWSIITDLDSALIWKHIIRNLNLSWGWKKWMMQRGLEEANAFGAESCLSVGAIANAISDSVWTMFYVRICEHARFGANSEISD